MYMLQTEQSFDAAHFLKDYNGKCSNIHGHRWRVVVCISAEKLSTEQQTKGMIIDFSDLKKALKNICDYFDHTFIYEENSLKSETVIALQSENFRLITVPFRPTAENFARFIYEKLKKEKYTVCRVEVYETPNNCAIYEE
ncbi:6-carboxytetrahydropterin synthase QueD [Tyzzerella sp. An114]|uniref:6-carboxytetrahydropterin synthase QueD n=1 Tax=Tyzzerella sp. An114 TaxID=1965545 RepID=UPI000B43AB7E|nr:6-carboxytetrahydropterin synthase QueD [Tyzzerella sp. An114]OUQ55940.1 6-carboxytetrahydropterin synthase QueD [Tyzzerella sp. An114]